jgi:hypothetical protein
MLRLGLVVLAMPLLAHAQPLPRQGETLSGIGALAVVASVDRDTERLGLDRQLLSSAVERRLRLQRIPVRERPANTPTLSVAIHTTRSGRLYALCISVRLIQDVRLEVSQVPALATTWQTDLVVLGEAAQIRETDPVLDLVDRFSRDYLSANVQ